MDKVKGHLVKVAESKLLSSITSALLETYSGLLIWLGTRNFQSMSITETHNSCLQVTKAMCDRIPPLPPFTGLLIPAVFKSQAWGVLYALLEIISFRVHLQLQFSYRFQLLQQLHTVANVSIIPSQLFIR